MEKNNKFVVESKVPIKYDVLMSNYTYTLTGGPAQYLAEPKTFAEISYLVKRSIEFEIPYLILGNASNVIVSDQGLKGLVIITTHFSEIKNNGLKLIVDAGAKLKDIADKAAEESLTGFEFACGIPGTLGGAIFMNAGAYGGEMTDIVKEITALDAKGNIKQYSHDEFSFSYRHSLAQDQNLVILQAVISLQVGSRQEIITKMKELNDRRAARQPLELPSCGSVFRRPPGHFVGPMIQEAGLQGKQIGGAQVSKKHAGFIVNIDHATATDYINLIHLIQETVFQKFGIHLKPEVRFLGFDEQS
ncbi:UDP-N-acetylmuramate dehydrogenase [Xylocopilactobacillus apis]|uniref:UDP-N-acetylmuramate dehydrogenase n=1 Tax=Xylocopilactobacillus apis TaxID=2932183 RepID=UPI0029536BBB|nr:UDP-N-acetylmuramate dehydrogenase [Xylocopilactobacillus apis]